MAHFAKIKNNEVIDVIVLNNEVIIDENGNESETLGIAFCKSLYGEDTEWIQTSYNGSFRGRYGMGCIYDPVLDEFVGKEVIEK
jgi:hypothetical protein